MRIVLGFLLISSFACCQTAKKTFIGEKSYWLGDLEINYINKFVVEHVILTPTDLDINSFFPLQGSTIDIQFIDLSQDKEFWSNESWLSNYLNGVNVQQVIPNSSPFVRHIFGHYKPRVWTLKELGGDEMKAYINNRIGVNTIIFLIGDIYMIDDKYYIPMLYWRRNNEMDYVNTRSRIYEFEVCGYGIINFTKFYEPLGFVSIEVGSLLRENIINKVHCY